MARTTGQVYQCPDCDKTFSRSEFVNRHVRTKHLGVRPYACACGTSYARSDLLLRHRKKCPRADEPVESPSPDAEADAVQGGRRRSSAGAPFARVATVDSSSSDSPNDGSPESSFSEAGPSSKQTHRHGIDCETTLQTGASAPWHWGNTFVAPSADDDPHPPPSQDWMSPSQVARKLEPPKNMFLSFIDPAFLRTDESVDSPYYLEPSVFALAFICGKVVGNSLPSVGTLSQYVRRAATTFLPFMPIVHLPTMRTSDAPMFLAYSWAVAGAACEDDQTAKTFANKSLVKKRDSVQRTFVERPNEAIDVRFSLLQTLLVYQFVGAFNCTDEFRLDAGSFVDHLIADLQSLPVQESIRNAPDYVEMAVTGQMPVEKAWKAWIRMESMKRTVFLVLIASQHSPTPPALTLADVDLPLPCHEEAWSAETALDWLEKLSFRGGSKPPSLSEALFNLDPNGAPPTTWLLGSFALTVLAAALQCAVKSGWRFAK